MESLVSVIISTYNHGKFICDSTASALNQTYNNVEIIVVNDGSTDNTEEILKPYMGKIRYIHQNNRGLSAARNTGIRASNGEYIAFLDADDIWLSTKLELQMKLILKSKAVGMVSCGNYYINEKGEITGQTIKKNSSDNAKLLSSLFLKNIVSGGSEALLRRECFGKVGIFDENLQSAEDWDMWLRIAKYYEIRFVELPLVKIRIRSDSLSSSSNADKMLQNELRVLKKIFFDKSLKWKTFLRMKAYSYRYFSAALAYYELEKIKEVRKQLLKSFFLCPFAFLNKSHLTLSLYAIVGKSKYDRIKSIFNRILQSRR